MSKRRIIVAITGAAGSIYGVRLLKELREHDGIETHLIVSRAGFLNVATELDMRRTELEALPMYCTTTATSAPPSPAVRSGPTGCWWRRAP